MKKEDKYKEVKTFTFPGIVARVYIPELTEGERKRRMNAIHKQAAELLRSTENGKG